ncbi:hypothetical protein [Streptomyces zagrosensis]|uniref:Uncharacterized protein n=1 Tax=Streptomyces zagrosensis TaxID=1042984 RepID=A0A7W9UYC9_9ACTN|nr:hypothetical protein [Streptomyces zagrosensis]MBB5934664.1 hypothetical protein [Streptomyces zagrosensis]
MSSTPAPTPPDAKLAALLAQHDRAAREAPQSAVRPNPQAPPQPKMQPNMQANSLADELRSCVKCRATRMVAEQAKALRSTIQHRMAIEALHVHRSREHPPNEGDFA